MKTHIIYFVLISLIAFLFFKKVIDLIVDVEFPTYTPPPTGPWKYLIEFRDSLSVISIFLILGVLLFMGRNTNIFITTILLAYLFYDILYFLFDWGYIYYFIDKNPSSEQFVRIFDIYLNAAMNIILGLFGFYSLAFIFYSKE
jgi:hypothetical protein